MLLAKRSKRQTRMVSNFRLRASAIKLFSPWSRILSAGFAHVDIFSKDFEFPRGAVGSQVAQLEVAALVSGADACIDRHSHSLDLPSRGRGGQGERTKRPFLNQEKASAKVLILPGANYTDSGPPF